MKNPFRKHHPDYEPVGVSTEPTYDMPIPHCDNLILHAPGECTYCDRHPYEQALRDYWQINYTNRHDPTKLPCPSTIRRADEVRDLWGGNQARPFRNPEEIS